MAIIGAGPAGLLLGQLLHRQGIEAVILEARDRDYVEARIRAGVLEQGTIDVLREAGVGERMDREGLRHGGIYLCFDDSLHHIPMSELTDGRAVMIYGQTEVVKDLIAARLADGRPAAVRVRATSRSTASRPTSRSSTTPTRAPTTSCAATSSPAATAFTASAAAPIPEDVLQIWGREYPYAWLGILADVAPSTDELIYAASDRGFALHSMRSPTRSRLYVQVDPDEDIANWPDDRIWSELHQRLASPGWELTEGPVLEKSITPMRSFVAAPMRYRSLVLAGDAAHIVPPTGAKGLNLAVADVTVLAHGARRSPARRQRYGARGVLRSLPGPGVAGPALLVVDDDDAPHRPAGRRVRPRVAALAAALCHQLDRRRHLAGRELRRAAARSDRCRPRRPWLS